MSQLSTSVASAMIKQANGNVHDVNHFLKVWSLAKIIGEKENIDHRTLQNLEIAALVHDIACPLCRLQYGNAPALCQEKEGPHLAIELLESLGIDSNIIERVAFLVGHHHTMTGVDGVDWQILLEADYLVNLGEGEYELSTIPKFRKNIFKTKTGMKILDQIYSEQAR